MNGHPRAVAVAMLLSSATFCYPFNIYTIRQYPYPMTKGVSSRGRRYHDGGGSSGSRLHLFGPMWQNQNRQQQRDGGASRNDDDRRRRRRSSTGGPHAPPHRVPESEIYHMGGGFGMVGRSSPPFPYAIELSPMPSTDDDAVGNDVVRQPDELIIRHLEDEDIVSILPEIVREFGSLAPQPKTPEPGDELSSRIEDFLFSLTVLIGLTQRVKRRREGYSPDDDDTGGGGSSSRSRPDHNVVCLVERISSERNDASYTDHIVGIAELSWQPPDPNRNAPPFVLPYYAKAMISRFFLPNIAGGDGGVVVVPVGYVSNVLVWKTRRGRGYGRVLMAACEGIARMWGCADVSLHVDANEYSGRVARELYSSLGYDCVPDDGRGGGRGNDSGGGAVGDYGWMGPSMSNRGLYLVDGVPLLYLRKSLREK
jgi:GNAT superfamily N-acetyltransferase